MSDKESKHFDPELTKTTTEIFLNTLSFVIKILMYLQDCVFKTKINQVLLRQQLTITLSAANLTL